MVVCLNTTRLSVGPGFTSTNKTFDVYKMSVKQEYKIFKACESYEAYKLQITALCWYIQNTRKNRNEADVKIIWKTASKTFLGGVLFSKVVELFTPFHVASNFTVIQKQLCKGFLNNGSFNTNVLKGNISLV